MARRRSLLGGAAALLLPRFARATAMPLRIGALNGPYAALFDHARSLALEHGLAIEVVTSHDPDSLNHAVAAGTLQAAACENTQLLDAANAAHHYDLKAAFFTATLPTGIYSRHVHAVVQLRRGDTIVLPSSPIERDRARVLLYNYGLLRAHEDDGLSADFSNIVNPIGFRLEDAAPDALAHRLADARAVLIPYDVAVASGLHPAVDSIGLEDGKSAYTGVLAVRAADRQAPWVTPLKRVFQSRDMRQFIYDHYGDSVQPPW